MNQERNTPSFQYSIGERFHSKCITSLKHDKRHLFAAGTCSLKLPNEIHVIEFLESEQKIQRLEVLKHPGIIIKLIANLQNENQLFVIYSEDGVNKKLSGIDRADGKLNFDLSIQRQLQNVISTEKEPKLFISDEISINCYDLMSQQFVNLFTSEDPSKKFTLCEQDPYHANLFARVHDKNNIQIQDTREKKATYKITNAHGLDILDLDFNPNKQYYFMTAGEDCMVKIWDLRKTALAMKSIDDLQNSALSAKFNKFHDQLLTISFDDGTIVLYRATSVSSVPIITQMNYQASSSNKDEDGVVKLYDEHEDSINSIAWSNATAWVFASVCINSNIIVNLVPIAEKYKILL